MAASAVSRVGGGQCSRPLETMGPGENVRPRHGLISFHFSLTGNFSSRESSHKVYSEFPARGCDINKQADAASDISLIKTQQVRVRYSQDATAIINPGTKNARQLRGFVRLVVEFEEN
jgi:hypothetical protein